jgi:hypothetical protein
MRCRHAWFLVLGLVVAACGPSAPDDDDAVAGDADGDGISDADEGAPGTDTDGDGTPDYLDDDSDDDGIPDYREAGDQDLSTVPVDSDGDGIPDFRDTDSDNNGRPDGVDGTDDLDGDGKFDFQDLDDDGDFISDVIEIGGNPAAPVDSDGDGVPDFQDRDSDGDTILDLYETASDYDQDGRPNYLDDDSDGDCIYDRLEARGDPPRDSDGDGRPDFLDRDSDNDGIPDGAEDRNCNGVRDGDETSATDDDTDNDGVSDLIETAAGTNPLDPSDNPQANGDFVFIVPYQEPPSPRDDDLDFATDLVSLDVYALIDRSGSMSGELTAVRNNLSAAIRGLQCPPIGTGDPATCIPDLWAGAGTVGYPTVSPYLNHVDIQPNPNFSTLPGVVSGSPTNEPMLFGLWETITGAASSGSGCSVSTVAARNCAGSPAQANGYSTFGYPCFRQGALPVVLLATDEAPLDTAGDVLVCPPWQSTVRPLYNNRSARIIGIRGADAFGPLQANLETLARDTGAVDANNNNAPLVFMGADANAATAIAQGIRTLAGGVPLDLSAVPTDDPSDAVNAITAFVDHLETLQLGTAQCANGLNDQDTNGDGFADFYVDVPAGTPVCWRVVVKQNQTVPATQEPQLFRATIDVYGDGVTILDSRDVYFLVPPVLFDPPVD